MKTDLQFWSYIFHFFLELRIFLVEKIKTQILCSIIFSFEERAVYEIKCKNYVETNRPQMPIRRMRIACWIP